MEDDQCFNILLFGETGVGKSTFINSFANYQLYSSFDEANSAYFEPLIPVKFTVADEGGNIRTVHLGADRNEDQQMGNSSTQGTKGYLFKIGDKKIRLLDTPGIGDTRGILKDKENFENILNFIGNFQYIHGFCFLMKPNVTVINSFFKFCLLELLKGLDKTACANIFFVFTNTRATDYTAPDTMSNLRRVINEIQRSQTLDIPLDSSNFFCIDNEGFKYLMANQEGIQFGKSHEMQRSWEVSRNRCQDLMNYVVNLKPHKVQDTLSINEARRWIVEISQPLLDVMDIVCDNIIAFQEQKRVISSEQWSFEELKKYLFISVLNIKVVPLKKPTTVCTSPQCTDVVKVGITQRIDYKTKCHNPCFLERIPKEKIGSRNLKNCEVMKNGVCGKCRCPFSSHMHIYYETKVEQSYKEDVAIKEELNTKKSIERRRQDCIQKLVKLGESYKKDLQNLQQAIAKFAHFLKMNSACPENDFFEDYLHKLIEREKLSEDTTLLNRYQHLKNMHARLIATIIDKSIPVGSQDIIKTITQLYGLPSIGSKILEMHMGLKQAAKAEHEVNIQQVDNSSLSKSKSTLQNQNNLVLDMSSLDESLKQLRSKPLLPQPLVPQLTEEDVRKIVREEFNALGLLEERPKKHRDKTNQSSQRHEASYDDRENYSSRTPRHYKPREREYDYEYDKQSSRPQHHRRHHYTQQDDHDDDKYYQSRFKPNARRHPLQNRYSEEDEKDDHMRNRISLPQWNLDDIFDD